MTDPSAVTSGATTRAPRLLGNVPALDGLRGVAVLIVIVFHTSVLAPSWYRLIKDGGRGVDAFFVLSGFLITALLLREEALDGQVRIGRFYLRRALRLLPALVLLLGVHAVYASIARLPAANERSSLGSVLFYYSNTSLRQLGGTEGLGHMWSLAVEEQFYIVWPLCVILFVGLRRKLSTVLVVMVGALVAIDVRRAVVYQRGNPVLVQYQNQMVTHADSLLIGALLAVLWVRRKVPTRGLSLAAWPALAFFAFLATNGASKGFLFNGGFTAVALAVAIMILALLESKWSFGRVLQLRPLRTIGLVSYGLYIWHLAVFQAIVHYGRTWSPATRVVTGLSVTVAACWISWTFVEQPFLRWKARLEPGRRRVQAASRAEGASDLDVELVPRPTIASLGE